MRFEDPLLKLRIPPWLSLIWVLAFIIGNTTLMGILASQYAPSQEAELVAVNALGGLVQKVSIPLTVLLLGLFSWRNGGIESLRDINFSKQPLILFSFLINRAASLGPALYGIYVFWGKAHPILIIYLLGNVAAALYVALAAEGWVQRAAQGTVEFLERRRMEQVTR